MVLICICQSECVTITSAVKLLWGEAVFYILRVLNTCSDCGRRMVVFVTELQSG